MKRLFDLVFSVGGILLLLGLALLDVLIYRWTNAIVAWISLPILIGLSFALGEWLHGQWKR